MNNVKKFKEFNELVKGELDQQDLNNFYQWLLEQAVNNLAKELKPKPKDKE